MVTLSRAFYNPELGWLSNCAMFWAWESVVHHLYFIVLFLQRQASETWNTGELWRLNMEKECAFFSKLFGGDATLCAESTMTLFSGLWFNTGTPTPEQLNWVGRIVTNYQHSEATIHFIICITGLLLIARLSDETKDRGAEAVPGWLRWSFFAALFFETWTMCVPYLLLFGWAWAAMMPPQSAIASTVEAMGGSPYLDGVQMGASLITMFWVSVLVLILDAWAMFRAWQFAMGGKDTFVLNTALFGGMTAAFAFYAGDFFNDGGRGANGHATLATITLDALHGLFGNDGNISMLDLARPSPGK
mmetsp:Transcript_2700/g.8140  ORF Transcript_2700/g.8140 Transcript_2700/m.8140 type:complete len:303 (-) Transcript_2700:112-1020(-)